jgi:hypothetical protein
MVQRCISDHGKGGIHLLIDRLSVKFPSSALCGHGRILALGLHYDLAGV